MHSVQLGSYFTPMSLLLICRGCCQVPASQPVPAKAPSQDATPKGPFGFVLPPLKFQPKNYDDDDDNDSDDVGYKVSTDSRR